jgi:hypothetical protein
VCQRGCGRARIYPCVPVGGVGWGCARDLPRVQANNLTFVAEVCPISLAELPTGTLLTVDRFGASLSWPAEEIRQGAMGWVGRP